MPAVWLSIYRRAVLRRMRSKARRSSILDYRIVYTFPVHTAEAGEVAVLAERVAGVNIDCSCIAAALELSIDKAMEGTIPFEVSTDWSRHPEL